MARGSRDRQFATSRPDRIVTSYPTPARRRTALVPGVLAAIVLVAGAALVGTGGFTWILFAVSILALIMCVFAWQAGHWWWLFGLIPIAIAWNPALVFVAAGISITVDNPENRNRR